MAKFRRTAEPQGSSKLLMKLGGLLILLVIAFYGIKSFLNTPTTHTRTTTSSSEQIPITMLPIGSHGELVDHDYFKLSYDEQHEQAEWVGYYLSVNELNGPQVERHDWFDPDPKVASKTAHHRDYKGSGYDRGHLVPSADMTFNKEANIRTFYMSNISPQEHNFNGGIWRELEELTRDWVRQNDGLYIITGPIFKDNKGRIGKDTKVTVPGYYYKALLDVSGAEHKAIGFIMPNEPSGKPVMDFAVPIDEIEAQVGYDLFSGLDDEEEDSLEAHIVLLQWPVDPNLYRTRVERWNKR